jgi:DNA-binding CsgD family transcriptional regulator
MMAKEDLNALIGGVVEALSSVFADSTNRSILPESGGFSSRGKQEFLRSFRQRLDMLNSGLTERELDVCARVIIGMTTEAIALELDLRAPTVATYRKRAYARLGISSHYEMFCLLTQ